MNEENKLTSIADALANQAAYSSESAGILAEQELAGAGAGRQEPKEPSTETERLISRLWSRVLQVERVGVNDDFFDLGGDSLKAQRVLAQVEREIGIRIPVLTAFSNPTVAQLSLHIDRVRRIGMTEEEELIGIINSLSDEEVHELLSHTMRSNESKS